jgi:hypothetical protein
MSTTDGYLPMATCPACKKEWQWDDYYDVRVGSDRECPNCGVTVEVLRMETLIYCTFVVKQPAVGKTDGR